MITVVTAPSRSGTSLTMQMLQAAGLSLAWDALPNCTKWNPLGHYEIDWRKGMTLDECEGKVIKVMPFDLYRLTPEHVYRFIMILRNPACVDASQAATVQHRGAEMSDAHRTHYWQEYTIRFIDNHPHIIVGFNELFSGSGQGKIGAFLDMTPLQIAKMCDCVDATMWHFKPEAK
jgi:hypothetical protein